MHSFGTYKVSDFLEMNPNQWVNSMCEAGRIHTHCDEGGYHFCEWDEDIPPDDFERKSCSPFCAIRNSYIDEFLILQKSLKDINLEDFYISFEYIIGRNGTRPDVLLVNDKQLFILEFLYITGGTRDAMNILAHESKLGKYVADFKFCHEQTLDKKEIISALVFTGDSCETPLTFNNYGDSILGADHLHDFLKERIKNGSPMNIEKWLNAEYNGSMSIVEGAIKLFQGKTIPRITYHESGKLPEGDNLPEAKEALIKAFNRLNRKNAAFRHCLCIITGVPGAGKTLLGLDFMFEELRKNPEKRNLVKYISASETLIDVLGNSIRPTFFGKIKDFNRWMIEIPEIIIYDEAQRAWSEKRMEDITKIKQSQASKIIERSETVSPSMVAAIIGRNQDIGPGESSNLTEWARAINKEWCVYCPPEFLKDFEEAAGKVVEVPSFNLDLALRYRGIQVSNFIDHLLDSSLPFEELKKECENLKKNRYLLLITANLELAKEFCKKMFSDSCNAFYKERAYKNRDEIDIIDPRYGVVESSHSRFKNYSVGVDTVKWYTADSDDALSCCSFNNFRTEYQALGFDLDMVILNWGDDLRISEEDNIWSSWYRRMDSDKDSDINNHIINAYRILMTRGKDGLIIYYPEREYKNISDMDKFEKQTKYTYKYLRDIGFDEITEDLLKDIESMPSKENK